MASALRCMEDPETSDGVTFAYVATLLGSDTTLRLIDRLGVVAGPGGRIGFIDAWKLLTANVALTADEGHQLAGAPVRPGNFELLMASMVQGADLDDGLARLAAGATIIRPDLSIRLSHRHGNLRLSLVLGDTPSLAAEIYAEALLVVIHCAVRWAVGRRIVPANVRGSAALADFHTSLLDTLDLPVPRHGTGASITYEVTDSAAPFKVTSFTRWHEASFIEYVQLIDERAFPLAPAADRKGDALFRDVRNAVMSGNGDQTVVARGLGMSVPTLRRRLADQRTSFRQICDDLRRDAAEQLLLGDKSVEEIAGALGMSDARCFRRACNGWFGRPPSELRRSMRDVATA